MSILRSCFFVPTCHGLPDKSALCLNFNTLALGYPVISVDPKKKELIGNVQANGTEYRKKKMPFEVVDHDLMIKELGKVSH
jgi:hypothetical protein